MKAKDARRGVTEQREGVPSKKKKSEPGRYVLQQRLDPDSSLARIVKKNVGHSIVTLAGQTLTRQVG